MGGFNLNWRGKQLEEKYRSRAATAINTVVAQCVREAKSNHAGWQNRTGTAEGSIQVLRPAEKGSKKPFAEWGSRSVVYMRRLEFEHGSALRNAAQREYPELKRLMGKKI